MLCLHFNVSHVTTPQVELSHWWISIQLKHELEELNSVRLFENLPDISESSEIIRT